ncbi:MAG: phosphoribosylanthranilate isomerase [Tepidisphaerales bacterium]
MAFRTRVKVCGVMHVEDALRAVRAGADAIGMIQVPHARRYIPPDTARAIAAALPPFVTPVLVFADAEPAHILDVAHQTGVRTVQLHGHETVRTALALHNLSVIKRLEVGITLKAELEHWALLERRHLSAVLLEGPGRASASTQGTAEPAAATPVVHGGTGILTDFDAVAWALSQIEPGILPPLILAGGLNPDNVAGVVRRFRPYAVDTSSGVENPAVPLRKDGRRLHAFIDAVTRANDDVA